MVGASKRLQLPLLPPAIRTKKQFWLKQVHSPADNLNSETSSKVNCRLIETSIDDDWSEWLNELRRRGGNTRRQWHTIKSRAICYVTLLKRIKNKTVLFIWWQDITGYSDRGYEVLPSKVWLTPEFPPQSSFFSWVGLLCRCLNVYPSRANSCTC